MSSRKSCATCGSLHLDHDLLAGDEARRVDLRDRRRRDRLLVELGEERLERPAEVDLDHRAHRVERLGRDLVAQELELGHQLVGEEPLAARDDLAELHVARAERLERAAQPSRDAGTRRRAAATRTGAIPRPPARCASTVRTVRTTGRSDTAASAAAAPPGGCRPAGGRSPSATGSRRGRAPRAPVAEGAEGEVGRAVARTTAAAGARRRGRSGRIGSELGRHGDSTLPAGRSPASAGSVPRQRHGPRPIGHYRRPGGRRRRGGDRGRSQRPRRRQPARRRRVAGPRARGPAASPAAPSAAPSSRTPGFVHDVFSAFYPLGVASPVMRAPRPRPRTGSRWRRAPLALAHPTADGGGAAVLSTAIGETARSLDELAPGDGDAWRQLYARVRAHRRPAARRDDVADPTGARRRRGSSPRSGPRGLLDFARTAVLSRAPARARSGSAARARRCCSPATRCTATSAPDTPPSGFLGWLLTCLGQQHGFPVPEGGAGRLTDALVAPARSARWHDRVQRAR